MAAVQTGKSPKTGSGTGHRMEKCLLSNEEIQLPEALLQDISVFTGVVNGETWQKVLSPAQRSYLMQFLPTFPENDATKKDETLERLFASQTFKFNSPLRQFHRRLKEGKFSPDIAKYTALIKRARLKEYRHQQKMYYSDLLKEILVSRQNILEQVSQLPPTEEPLKLHPRQHQVATRQQRSLEYKVKWKFRKVIKEVNEECGLEDTSSEEEDDRHMSSKGRKQLFKVLSGQESPPEVVTMPSVLATFASKPLMMNGDSGGQSAAAKKGLSPIQTTAEDFMEMLRRHRKRRADSEDHPDLDTTNLSLDEILLRAQPGRKALKATGSMSHHGPSGKKKPKEATEKKRRVKIEEESQGDDNGSGDVAGSQNYKHAVNFFCLLQNIICERPDCRITTSKLEDRVREWQDSPSAVLFNDWFREHSNWGELVQSALMFLSGNVLGLSLENFVPLLDYKERAQQWKWIGQGRDSDAELSVLCQHWLENKDDIGLDPSADGATTPPPARSSTTFHVRPTTEEEKTVFREQEQMRFTEPQKAFTYRMHNYESIVGPVKGVYSKGNAMNKAREHALLVSDRPAYVTILTLVRDAAARLPNGEGTRSDICELLKDSQFLAPGVTDAQVNTVVSGALDRLHYEKDPCVKYDVNRKLWIYLHRSRTEDEFEKIHQAQGAAAKARKALQKPKPSKKIKEAMSLAQGALAASISTADATFAHPALSLATPAHDTKDSILSAELPSPGSIVLPGAKATVASPKGSPRAQASPRGVMKTVVVSGVNPMANVMKVGGGQLTLGTLKISMPQNITHLQGALLHGQPPSPKTSKLQQVPVAYVAAGSPKPGQPQFVPQKPLMTQFMPTQHITGAGKGMSVSFVSQPQDGGAQKGILAPTILAGRESLPPDSKPVAFSLIQTQDGTLRAAQQPHGAPQPRTVVLTTAAKTDRSGTPKFVATVKAPQQLSHRLVAGTSVAPSPGLRAQSPSAASLAPRMSGKPLSGATSRMAVARLVQQLGSTPQQVISMATRGLGNVPRQVVRMDGSRIPVEANTTVKIQGGSMVQSVGEAPPVGEKLQIQRTVSFERRDSAPDGTFKGEVPCTPPGKTQMLTPGGKPATLIITKPSTPPVTMTTASVVQLLQSNPAGGRPTVLGGKPIIIGGKPTMIGGKPTMVGGKPTMIGGKPTMIGGKPTMIGGKPTMIGGKPTMIGGKPTMIGGKPTMVGGKPTMIGGKPTIFSSGGVPMQLSGKPVQVGGKPFQIGGKPVQMVGGKPVQIGGKPVQFAGTPVQMIGGKPVQIVGKPFQLIGKPRVAGVSQAGGISPLGLVTQPSCVVTLSGASPAPSSLVTQILQSAGTLVHPPPAATALTGSRLGGPGGGVRGLTMTRMVNPSQIIVTGLPQSSTVRPGIPMGSQAHMVAVSQGSLLGNQIVVQQSPNNTRVITPQQVITGSGGRPTFVTSQPGWPAAAGRQLQMLRTVMTQAGGKPGQTTILLAQPSGQPGSSLVTSTGQVLQTATMKGIPQAGLKNSPMYARIITPPPGVRLVGVRGGQGAVIRQVVQQQGVGVVRGVGKVDASSLVAPSVVVTTVASDGASTGRSEQN